MPKPKAIKSFAKSRKKLLAQMTSKAKGESQDKVIPFLNDDVPNFLRNLDDFEEKSRECNIIIK